MESSNPTRRLLSRRFHADVVAGGVTVAFGVFFTVAALAIPSSTFANSVVQPKHLPVVIGIGLLLTGIALTVKGLVVSRRPSGAEQLLVGIDDAPPLGPVAPREADGLEAEGLEAEGLEEIPEPVENLRHLVVVAALLVCYLVAFEPLGFVAATFLFLLAGATYLQPRRLARNVVYALVLSVAVYLLFDVLLGIVLPQGVLAWLL